METNLRVLVVLPLYGGSLPIGRYCARALTDLGCHTRVFEANKLYCAYTGLKQLDMSPSRINVIQDSFLKLVSQAVWSMAEEQKPHIVLALAQAPLDKFTLLKMRKAGMATIMWFVEDYRLFNYWLAYAPLYDAFAVIQKEPFLQELSRVGQPHAFYLPLAALPDFHKPETLTDRERKIYGSDISFLGAGYPNRRLAFRPLADRDFKIWGSDWDGETILAKNIQRNGARIGEDESVKIYNAAKINLNLHSSVKTDNLAGGGDFVNPRTFELASMGAFQLVDDRSLLGECFTGDEMATFSSVEDFYNKIDYFLERPEEREKYALAARARVLKDHTYQQRMSTLLKYMEDNFGPFADVSPVDAYKDMDPAFKKEIMAHLGKLGLSPDASFEDVVTRIRQRQGELTPFETAVLFLDEWRKQYKK